MSISFSSLPYNYLRLFSPFLLSLQAGKGIPSLLPTGQAENKIRSNFEKYLILSLKGTNEVSTGVWLIASLLQAEKVNPLVKDTGIIYTEKSPHGITTVKAIAEL